MSNRPPIIRVPRRAAVTLPCAGENIGPYDVLEDEDVLGGAEMDEELPDYLK